MYEWQFLVAQHLWGHCFHYVRGADQGAVAGAGDPRYRRGLARHGVWLDAATSPGLSATRFRNSSIITPCAVGLSMAGCPQTAVRLCVSVCMSAGGRPPHYTRGARIAFSSGGHATHIVDYAAFMLGVGLALP
jgi:hypothetical protein